MKYKLLNEYHRFRDKHNIALTQGNIRLRCKSKMQLSKFLDSKLTSTLTCNID